MKFGDIDLLYQLLTANVITKGKCNYELKRAYIFLNFAITSSCIKLKHIAINDKPIKT